MIIALLIGVPILFSIIYYVKCPLSLRYRHCAVIAFYVVFEVSCLSSDLFLYNIFIFPVMIAGDAGRGFAVVAEEISAASEETTAMCTQNSERFRDVNSAVEELAAEAERMGRYIDEYTRLHRAETAVDDGSKKRGDNKSDGKINNLVTGVAS